MYRFSLPLFLSCFAGPLWACSCGGTIAYAPIVASPVTTFVRTAETIETIESVVPKKPDVRTTDKPAIPKSIYPDSFAKEIIEESVNTVVRKPRPTLRHLQIYELPNAIRVEQPKESPDTQTAGKPPITTLDDSEKEQPPGKEEETNNTENTVILLQSPSSQRGGDEIKSKPDSPEGPSSVPLPGELKEPLTKNETKESPPSTNGPSKHKEPEEPDQDNSVLPGSVSGTGGTGGNMDSQSWTITALVLLSAISTVAFLCTVFVVGEYRKRWLNAIMSQNGMVPNFQGGLYDVPSLSIGYRRYED